MSSTNMPRTSLFIERRAYRRAAQPIQAGLVVLGLRLAETAAVALAGVLAWFVHPELESIGPRPAATIALGTVAAAWLLERCGAYQFSYVLAPRIGLRRQLGAWVVAVTGLVLAAFMFKVSESYSRLWVALWFTSGAGLLIAVRMGFALQARAWARDARLARRTVVVGTTEHGQRLARHLSGCPDICMRVVGFVDDDHGVTPSHVAPYPVLGDIAYLVRMIRRNEVDQVVIALPWSERERIMRLLGKLAQTPVDIRLAPELLSFEFVGQRAETVAGIPLLRMLDRPVSGTAALLKAAEDLILSGLLLVACAPVMVAIAFAIKLDSPGPVFFRQMRYGFNDNLIRVWKFRTMQHSLSDPTAATLTRRNDPRVTRVGRFLRRTSLDELPQLFNVFHSEMSLVGPRPHALEAKAGDQPYQDVMDNYAARHRVKPGLTGWAQINGWRGETDTCEKLKRRVEHDLYYIEHWSLWLDLRILARTVWVVLSTRNAF